MKMVLKNADFNKQESWKMFDQIAKTYDKVNRLLSFRQDVKWRKKVVNCLPENQDNLILVDVATGTCDLLISLVKDKPEIKKAIGIDMSQKMLRIGEKKLLKEGIFDRSSVRVGDCMRLPVENNYCDVATIAFGIRNISNPIQGLKDIYRILKPKGRCIILEFSIPRNFLFRLIYLFYFRYILPLIGGFVSKNYKAYRYLNQTVETFPYSDEFLQIMEKAGFKRHAKIELSFGIATIYIGYKGSSHLINK